MTPTVDPFFTKGIQEPDRLYVDGSAFKVRATHPDRSWVFAASPWVDLEASRRYEFILLGDKLKNAKSIVWLRPINEPSAP